MPGRRVRKAESITASLVVMQQKEEGSQPVLRGEAHWRSKQAAQGAQRAVPPPRTQGHGKCKAAGAQHAAQCAPVEALSV